jgi:DNA-directed RNA polymerase subunit omega
MKSGIIENKYRKVLVAAQRARQLEKGARPLLQATSTKRTAIALQEVGEGLIGFELLPDPKDVEAIRT